MAKSEYSQSKGVRMGQKRGRSLGISLLMFAFSYFGRSKLILVVHVEYVGNLVSVLRYQRQTNTPKEHHIELTHLLDAHLHSANGSSEQAWRVILGLEALLLLTNQASGFGDLQLIEIRLPSVSPKIALNIEVLVVDHWSLEEGQGHLDPRLVLCFGSSIGEDLNYLLADESGKHPCQLVQHMEGEDGVENLDNDNWESRTLTLVEKMGGFPVSTKGKPTKLHKRKHQIGSLYFDMKQKEMELSERRAKGFLTKAETQAKYGW
ncbi:hypothetical protein CK203_021970 [Vitis vinifera]|uniref:Proline-rich protein PRCC n=1 Tax=Vitis vinifera TaxID=29760 RepID=A0A438JFM0_VITVI|nr:hypothetical protein CK203_021970 [Vitis vinifera]